MGQAIECSEGSGSNVKWHLVEQEGIVCVEVDSEVLELRQLRVVRVVHILLCCHSLVELGRLIWVAVRVDVLGQNSAVR